MKELTAQVEKTIPASASQIWEALTTPATLKKFFFGADVETDWKRGSPIRFKGEFKGKPYEDKGEVLKFEPQQRLSFSHWSALSGQPDAPENYHIVTFRLVPRAGWQADQGHPESIESDGRCYAFRCGAAG